jgi:transposase
MPWSKTNRDVPIIGATRDGNSSDKTLTNELLGSISRHMARHGIDPGAFIYVADSALITHDNLKRAVQNGIHFRPSLKTPRPPSTFARPMPAKPPNSSPLKAGAAIIESEPRLSNDPSSAEAGRQKKTDFDCFFPKTRGYK